MTDYSGDDEREFLSRLRASQFGPGLRDAPYLSTKKPWRYATWYCPTCLRIILSAARTARRTAGFILSVTSWTWASIGR